jgi:spore germination protein KA
MRFMQKLLNLLRQGLEDTEKKTPNGAKHEDGALYKNLNENLDALRKQFSDCCDLVIREFTFGHNGAFKAALVFLDGLSDLKILNESIVKPLMYDSRLLSIDLQADTATFERLRDRLISAGDIKTLTMIAEITESCLSGNALLLVDGFAQVLEISAKGWDKRAVSEPSTETVLRGPREGFIENMRTNTAMIRRKIRSPSLKIRPLKLGDRSNTQVSIVYLESVANPELVAEVERRLKNIKTDAVLSAGNVEQYIEDSTYSPFQTMWYSEKPDTIAAQLLEGRVAVLVDGTPFVLTMPMLFIENFQTSEDYAVRTGYATALRILRFIAFIISLFGPATYVALTTFHQELIPTTLLFTMAASSEGLPFPAALEAGIMMLAFEILKEAGVRMPRPIGQAISIVGALVMGEAAVQAGLVGAPIVIVIAITAVASFVVPFVSDAVSILRWFLLILAASMGTYGITLGAFGILIHLTALRSFGTNYLAPFAPLQEDDLKDTFVRVPLWAMRSRPRAVRPQDMKRQDFEIPFYPAASHDAQGGNNEQN